MLKQDLRTQPEQILPAALRYLGRREYTAAELRNLLQKRGAAAAEIDAAFAYLLERKYLDDARAGLAHIRDRLRFAPRGRALVRQELLQRGLAPELTADLLAEHYPREAERDALERFLAKQKLPAATDMAALQKHWLRLARRAAAKGFETADILMALEEWRTLQETQLEEE